jgi:tetratricopeptide (TPR) repeat protein
MTKPFTALLVALSLTTPALAAEPKGDGKPVKEAGDADLVQRVISARKEYQQSLVVLYQHYDKTGDRERAKWVEEELKTFHLMTKPSYRLDINDVPAPTLEAKTNIKEANDLFIEAMKYKDKGTGTDFVLNQKRAELLLREILDKHPTSDKIADVAYQLGELYEGRAFKQYDRAAAFFERAYQWRKGTRTDARMRAAVIYDRNLNERTKAIELYRDQIAHDTDAERIKLAERRLAEITARGGR